MFNFGDNDKEKLKENMEEIKEMVDRGEGIQESSASQNPQSLDSSPHGEAAESIDTGDTESFESSQSAEEQQLEEDLETFEEKFGSGNQEQAGPPQKAQNFRGDQGNQAAQPSEGQQNTQTESFQDQPSQELQDQGKVQGQQPSQPPQRPKTAQQGPESPEEQHRSRSEKSGVKDSRDLNSLSQEVPSPPETREIDVPEIDRGPLFLRRQKFRRAKQLIDEMMYLTREVEETVNGLEAGIQEDQATERDVREMLKELEGGRSDVEDIISPREE